MKQNALLIIISEDQCHPARESTFLAKIAIWIVLGDRGIQPYIPVELFLRYINAYDGCLNLLLISIHIVRPDKDISNDKHKGKRFSTTTHKQAVNP